MLSYTIALGQVGFMELGNLKFGFHSVISVHDALSRTKLVLNWYLLSFL